MSIDAKDTAEAAKDNLNNNIDVITEELGNNPKLSNKDKEQLQEESQDLKTKINKSNSKNPDTEKKDLVDSLGEWLNKIKDFISSDKLKKIGQSILNFADKALGAAAEITRDIKTLIDIVKDTKKGKGLEDTFKAIDTGIQIAQDINKDINKIGHAVGDLVDDISKNTGTKQPANLEASPLTKQDTQRTTSQPTSKLDENIKQLAAAAGEGLSKNAKLVKDDAAIQKSSLPLASKSQGRSACRA